MTALLLVLMAFGMITVFICTRNCLGRKMALPLAFLVFLASTGQMFHARFHVGRLLVSLGICESTNSGAWWNLSFYGPEILAPLLAIWLGIEIACRFPFQGPRLPRCRKCGYDLRGNTSGTCPECGQEVLR
jgi:hypothetical protein